MTYNILGRVEPGSEATLRYPAVDETGQICFTERDSNPETYWAPTVSITRSKKTLFESSGNPAKLIVTDDAVYIHFTQTPRSSSWSGIPEVARAVQKVAKGADQHPVLVGKVTYAALHHLMAHTSGVGTNKLLLGVKDASESPPALVFLMVSLQRGKVALKSLDTRPVALDIHRRAIAAKQADPRFAKVTEIATNANPFAPGGPKNDNVSYSSANPS